MRAFLEFFCCAILSVLVIILGGIGLGKDEDNRMAKAGMILDIISPISTS